MAEASVLISGAGVAGPALAYWLRRRGFRPTVVERASEDRGGGYDLDFRGEPVLTVLERMGVLDELRKQRTPGREIVIVDGAGNQATIPPFDEVGEDLEIRKSDLSRILREATDSGVTYLYEDTITALEQGDDSVRVTFEKAEPREFDLVIGADGQHSIVRKLVFGHETDFLEQLGMASAGFTTENIFEKADRGILFQAQGAFAGINCRADDADMHVILSFAAGSVEYRQDDVDGQKKVVAERFAELGWEIPRLLAAMEKASDFYFDTTSQIKMSRWSDGRVVLLGDAAACAAPTSGYGPSQAILGAYVLAGELAATDDHERAFAAYEDQLRPYVEQAQHIGAQAARWYFHPEEAPETEPEPGASPFELKDYSA